MNSRSKMISTSAIVGAISVLLGAFGAHALKSQLSAESIEIYKTGISYLQFHALGMLGYALWWPGAPTSKLPFIGFLLGSCIFTGSLIALVLTGITGLGAITPIGGVILISSWIGFAVQSKKQS